MPYRQKLSGHAEGTFKRSDVVSKSGRWPPLWSPDFCLSEGIEMGTALVVIWGIALLVIAILSALLVWSLRSRTPTTTGPVPTFKPLKDTLLFYYEEQSTRSTAGREVIIRIPGTAWDTDWRSDLLRLEIVGRNPRAVVLPAEWGAARVLAAYELRAYRMTEMGKDLEIERFASPIDVILTTEESGDELRVAARPRDAWIQIPPADVSPGELEVDLPGGRRWAAASVVELGELCLLAANVPSE